MAPVAAAVGRRGRLAHRRRAGLMGEQQRFSERDRVMVAGHADHALPPALEGCTGWRGNISAVKGGDLYDVRLDDDDPVPTVQLHAAQLERVDS